MLEARKAENELVVSKVPNREVIYVDGEDAAGLPLESPESIMRGTAEVLRAVNIQDDQCKSSCYFARCWVVRIDLTWLSRYRASQTDDATEEEERLADCATYHKLT